METDIKSVFEQTPLTVAQLAIINPGALAVFKKYNIDYCCGGDKSFLEACREMGLDPEKIKAEIDQVPATNSSANVRAEMWSSILLVDYILQNHHAYVRRAIPELEPLLDLVCERHSTDCPELLQIRACITELFGELASHMEKEETVLFPAIKQYHDGQWPAEIPVGLDMPIQAMEHEHAVAGDLVKKVRSLSNQYTPPSFACPSFRITYQKLKEFEDDLLQHIHLENNILFPRLKSNQQSPG